MFIAAFRFRRGMVPIFIVALLIIWGQGLSAQTPSRINFENDRVGTFPSGWDSREMSSATEIYSVLSEGEKKFLRADAKGVSVQIGYEKKWVLKEFPTLQWQWRAVLFPSNTNEREKSGDDSVLGLYVVFGHWPFIKSLKYIWSDTLPIGASFNSPFSKSSKIIVVRSGRALMGKWVSERRDILADYEKLFGDDKAPVTSGVAILTDSDNTDSHAIGDYADIEFIGPAGTK